MQNGKVTTVEAVILKRRNSGEADRILTVFSRQRGKLRLVAKGVRRITSRRAGHIEVFSRVTLTIHQGKTHDILTEAHRVTPYQLGADITQMSYAYLVCELVDRLLPDEQEHADVFSLLHVTLGRLQQGTKPKEWKRDVIAFAHELLWLLGFLPRGEQIAPGKLRPFIEEITHRRLKSALLLTKLTPAS